MQAGAILPPPRCRSRCSGRYIVVVWLTGMDGRCIWYVYSDGILVVDNRLTNFVLIGIPNSKREIVHVLASRVSFLPITCFPPAWTKGPSVRSVYRSLLVDSCGHFREPQTAVGHWQEALATDVESIELLHWQMGPLTKSIYFTAYNIINGLVHSLNDGRQISSNSLANKYQSSLAGYQKEGHLFTIRTSQKDEAVSLESPVTEALIFIPRNPRLCCEHTQPSVPDFKCSTHKTRDTDDQMKVWNSSMESLQLLST